MTLPKSTILASVLLFSAHITAFGSTVSVSLSTNIMTGSYDQGLITYLNANGSDEEAYMGVIQAQVDGGPIQMAFCIDLFHDIGLSTYNVSIAVPDAARQGQVSWLINNLQSMLSTPEQYAGMQLAIWDLIEDGGDGFDAGLVRQGSANNTNPVALAFAQDYLNYLVMHGSPTSTVNQVFNITSIPDGIHQQTLMAVPTVPEPSTLPLTVAGGLAVMALAHQRKRLIPARANRN